MRRSIGAFVLALPFAIMFIIMANVIGAQSAFAVFVAACIVFGWIFFGVYLVWPPEPKHECRCAGARIKNGID